MKKLRDFVKIQETSRNVKMNGEFVTIKLISPEYTYDCNNLMMKGGAFYAVLKPGENLWSQNESDLLRYIDEVLENYVKDHYQLFEDGYKNELGCPVYPQYLRDSSTGRLIEFKKWLNNIPKNMNYIPLDSAITFKSDKVKPEDYRSKRLSYDMVDGPCPNYELLISTLYDEENRRKLEWSIGSILAGDSVDIEKFVVIYGEPGKGKSTVIKIIGKLFNGYTATFKADDLVSTKNQFSTAVFKDNPLVGLQNDGKMVKIESPVINEIVSHETIIVNEKNVKQYTMNVKAFLFLSSNDPVDIHDTKLGIVRRLIDVYPSNNVLPVNQYRQAVAGIDFEIPAIAYHCYKVYKKLGKDYYLNYKPYEMIKMTNYLENFLFDNYELFEGQEYVFRNVLYLQYKQYCEESGLGYPPKRIVFGGQLKPYFENYWEVKSIDGKSFRHVYSGFKKDLIVRMGGEEKEEKQNKTKSWLTFSTMTSVLDKEFSKSPAQYATTEGYPKSKWINCKTTLEELDTSKLHWVKLPEDIIKMDFDLKDENGNKNLELNMEAASKFPPTYAEVSKSGCGIHLYYHWKGGDPNELAESIQDNIEIKKSTGNNSHRRILSKCNAYPIATICSGLPKKETKVKMVDKNYQESQQSLIKTIEKCLNKEVHDDTSSNIDYIFKILNDAYNSGIEYDVSSYKDKVYRFALNSSNQSDRCVSVYNKMHFKSKNLEDAEFKQTTLIVKPEKNINDDKFVFYDVESYPDLFLLCYKYYKQDEVFKMYNPEPMELIKLYDRFDNEGYKYGGFNNRGYDDHMICAAMLGYSPKQLSNLSQAKIAGQTNCNFPEAYRFADFDLYDLSSIKKSLKKFEIDLSRGIRKAIELVKSGVAVKDAAKMSEISVILLQYFLDHPEIDPEIKHEELDFPWDKPVGVENWQIVGRYCENDVRATEAVFMDRYSDYITRCIVAKMSGLKPIDTNRQHIVQYLTDGNSTVQNVYTNLASGEQSLGIFTKTKEGMKLVHEEPFKSPHSFKMDFPGYEFNENGIALERYTLKPDTRKPKSIYHGEDPSEGGCVRAAPGVHYNVVCYDVAGMHPASIIALWKLGVNTKKYNELRDARLCIKHKDYDGALKILGEEFRPYFNTEEDAKNFSTALKLFLNSTYGIMAATFDNPIRDPRDRDNIVAKRGALFMLDLKEEVQNRGFEVVHIKTDSIKVVNPTPELEEFIMGFGHLYGYDFEVEHRFQRFCLINDAVYIAQNDDGSWEATGARYKHPYVFKKLFTHEPITFDDLCETKSVTTSMYLDYNESCSDDHNYSFIGRTGLFVPVIDGVNGGILVRKSGEDKYDAVTGTKGYRWLEASQAKSLDQNVINMDYFDHLAEDAKSKIEDFCPFDEFINR